jgi:hypothetical protein
MNEAVNLLMDTNNSRTLPSKQKALPIGQSLLF